LLQALGEIRRFSDKKTSDSTYQHDEIDIVVCILSYLPAAQRAQKTTTTESEYKMAIADLKNVLKIFGGSDVSDDEKSDLFQEVLLMTLARAANADINIQTVEVERIAEILKERTGQEFSAVDIRVAAREELYAEATLRKYLASVRRKLTVEERAETMAALADVFRVDKSVSILEVDFYNRVAEALQVSAADLAGLDAGDVA
jgi:uncharacterized tellurite resistance protein B-like protein